jgi:endoglycosylceramidase
MYDLEMNSSTLRGASAVVCWVTLACAGCSQPPKDEPAVRLSRVTVENGVFVDALGRTVVLRGVNARVEGLFDVTFDDGRQALEPIPAFGVEDCAFLSETLGMNLLRLPVNWSGIEPVRGEFNQAYLDEVVALVEACQTHGVYTLVDLHQDAYSKHIGEDGAPLWAIVPPPTELLEGPLDDLEARRVSGQVVQAFGSFFRNEEGLQDAYAEMAAVLAVRIAPLPGVVGLELLNEPVVPNDPSLLDPFHAKVAARVRVDAPDLPLFFEPDAVRNFLDRATVAGPFPEPNSAYAPHIYTGVFTGNWTPDDAGRLEMSIDNAVAEADAYGSALLVGEFGNDPNTELGRQWLDVAFVKMDAVAVSWALWLYEERSQGRWGLFEADGEEARGAIRADVVGHVARPFPAAVEGGASGWVYDLQTQVLTVALNKGGAVELAVPAHVWTAGAVATCDGAEVSLGRSLGRASTQCDGASLVVSPSE